MKKNYKRTLAACYLGFVTQAISANFAPLLFLRFHNDYSISWSRIALISTVFFFSQLLVDVFCAKFVDKIGYRKAVVASEIASAVGLVGLAFLPELFPSPYAGIIISVVIYAVGSGLIEVLVSPIVEACPFDNKESAMAMLHSTYCWGSVAVILISTLFFAVFGTERWRVLACLWALVPLYNIYNFAVCPIEHLTEDGQGLSIAELIKMPMFAVACILMICAGASELAMSQWASAYVESALGFSKSVGDILGPCLFAASMGISRTFYGRHGDKINLFTFMTISGISCVACYLLASLSENPVFGLIGCIVCGAAVAIMWPGVISISSKAIPLGGTAMFALLAVFGDLGGSLGPAVVGFAAQSFGDNLKIGMLAGCIFPLILVISVYAIKKMIQKTD